MSSNILAIYDSDEAYVSRLTEYLNRKRKGFFEVHGFTEPEGFHYMEGRPAEVLMVSETIRPQELQQITARHIIIMAEEEQLSEDSLWGSESKVIYKYQSAENILREIMSYYAETADFKLCAKSRAKLIGVYSPGGGCHKTTFSLVLGQILSERARTLYVNLEGFSGFSGALQQQYREDMSDLLYYIRQKKHSIAVKLEGMVCALGKLDYLPPFGSPPDMLEISGGEWLNMIDVITESGVYGYVILDMGAGIRGLPAILERCQSIYVPGLQNVLGNQKNEEFMKFLARAGMETISSRINRVEIPFFREAKEAGPDDAERLAAEEYGSWLKRWLTEGGMDI